MPLTPAERVLLQRRLAAHPRRSGRFVAALIVVLASLPLLFATSAAVGLGVAYASLAGEIDAGVEEVNNLRERSTFESVKIYDRNHILLREVFNEGRRTRVGLATLPRHLLQATIAVEDASFYSNAGVDPMALVRVAYQAVLEGEVVSGASTITQQYVRHIAFPDKERLARSYERKLKEIVLALIMTQRFSKEEILEGYLNEIYYGNLAYGVEAASQVIFAKSAAELDLAEAAMLAGLPQAPLAYDPLDPAADAQKLVKTRQRTVLDLMVRAGFISAAEADRAAGEPLTYSDPAADAFLAPHFVVYVNKLLEEELGPERMATGGLAVETTLDLQLQSAVEGIVRERVDAVRERNNLTSAAAVVLEPRTGQILAMVGSKDYWDDAIDGRVNVALSQRQPGSSIKPITYAAAIEQGIPAWTMLWDVPMTRGTPQGLYQPVNYDGVFHGPVRLRTALANSYNIPALKLLEMVGVKEMIRTANRMGIASLDPESDRYGLSLTLGGGEVTLLELTNAFATLANGGGAVRPNPILRITKSDGTVLYERAADRASFEPAKALEPGTAYIVTDILSDNAARAPAFGTTSPLSVSVKAAAKTGTTNDYRDNWTVGYTPFLTVGVWAGNADNSAMRGSTGVTGAAPIWHDVIEKVVVSRENMAMVKEARESMGFPMTTSFDRPREISEVSVCVLESLNRLGPTCPETRGELVARRAGDAAAPAPSQPAPPGVAGGAGTLPAQASNSMDVWTVVPAVAVPAAPLEGGPEPPPWPPAVLCTSAGPGRGFERMAAIAVLPLPADTAEREAVVLWAAQRGWVALEPTAFCSSEMAASAIDLGSAAAWTVGGDGRAIPRAEYHLAIAPGTVLTQTTALTGTVRFDPALVEYYKIELGAGRVPQEWITIGSTRTDFVIGGRLQVLDAPSLAVGEYVVRLVLVGKDGNFIQPPHAVPIVVGR